MLSPHGPVYGVKISLIEVEARIRERIRARRISRTDDALDSVGEAKGEVVKELQVARVGRDVELLIAQPQQQLE